MPSLQDISSRVLRELLGTRTYSRTLVNLQDGTATFDGVSEPDAIMRFDIAGEQCTAADVTNKALVTLAALQNPVTGSDGYYSQPKSTTVYYLAVVNAAGTVYVIQGKYSGQTITVNGANHTVSATEAAELPDIAVPDTYAPFAAFKVVNGTNAVWIPATTNWDATSVVSYAAPISTLPGKAAADLAWVEGGA